MGESVDVIDYTLLRKKGTLGRAHSSSPTSAFSANPLASFVPASSSSPSVPAPSSSSPSGFFGFMDAPASPPSSDSSSLSALQIKVDDFEYKLSKLTEQLALLEGKLGSLGGAS